ncbi:hypothetical protein PAAG_02587 [Paracoccidioides lutzii Pb01]|uniref:Uncharacterized protein n=1 Tax=Paracoccidioides lutzii (strain ATCC MYA-826 / Pb01) TaxID=502779 RepID=C1GVB4_PARBA|nr:hypothetical protein PAAG_02587 [Paracoccidioides lutzii Pb01]EEH40532.2 hypothetical protein PAAG_02587 [Paracoccidioides lutzii Pb01]
MSSDPSYNQEHYVGIQGIDREDNLVIDSKSPYPTKLQRNNENLKFTKEHIISLSLTSYYSTANTVLKLRDLSATDQAFDSKGGLPHLGTSHGVLASITLPNIGSLVGGGE